MNPIRAVAAVAVIAAALAPSLTLAELPTSLPRCVGDCDSSTAVTVDEVLVGVNIALGQRPLNQCRPFDRDGNESLTVDELVSGLDAALNGCAIEEVEGPVLTALVLVRPDDVVLVPATTDERGRDVDVRPFGSGFSIVVEARPGLDGAEVGRRVFEEAPDLPSLRPDIQVIVSSDLGDGSPVVCDDETDPPGGVPAADPFGFQQQGVITNVINEVSCRIDGGGRTNDVDACTLSVNGSGFGYDFVDSSSKVQFCLPIARAWAFPVGDTVVAARVLDILGAPGEIHEVVVRVLPAPSL